MRPFKTPAANGRGGFVRLGLGAGDPQQPRKVALDLQLELAQALDGNEHHLVDQRADGVAGTLAVDLVKGCAQLLGHSPPRGPGSPSALRAWAI